jgi:hypothetical protein
MQIHGKLFEIGVVQLISGCHLGVRFPICHSALNPNDQNIKKQSGRTMQTQTKWGDIVEVTFLCRASFRYWHTAATFLINNNPHRCDAPKFLTHHPDRLNQDCTIRSMNLYVLYQTPRNLNFSFSLTPFRGDLGRF